MICQSGNILSTEHCWISFAPAALFFLAVVNICLLKTRNALQIPVSVCWRVSCSRVETSSVLWSNSVSPVDVPTSELAAEQILLILLQYTVAAVTLWRDEPSNHWVVRSILCCKSTGVGLNKARELQGILGVFSRAALGSGEGAAFLWGVVVSFPALCRGSRRRKARKAVLKCTSNFRHLWGSFCLKREWYLLGCWLWSVVMETTLCSLQMQCKPQTIHPGFSKEFFLTNLFFSLNTCVHQGSGGVFFSLPHLHQTLL